jgi:hypothetical protein
MPYNFNPKPSRGIRLFAIAIWALATAALLASGLVGWHENHLFATESEHTQGLVEAKAQQTSTGRYGGLRRQSFLSYSYFVNGTNYTSGDLLVAGSTWSQFHVHDSIPVIYLRDTPADSRPDVPAEKTIYDWMPDFLLPFGVLIFVAGLFAMFGSRRRA